MPGLPAADMRHARQARLAEVGLAGQERLRKSRALVVGLGGLGSPAAQLLVGAGAGTVGLCDFDRVDASNLHRQTLYAAADVGRPKVEAARDRLAALDASIRLRIHAEALTPANAAAIVAGYDVVVDGLDDLAARLALSDAARAARIPVVHGAVSRWEGQVTVWDPPAAPCYRCLHPAPAPDAPTCAEEGVAGPVPAAVGALQAAEALKILLGQPGLRRRLLLLDALSGEARTINVKRRPGCPCAVKEPVACPLPWAAPPVPDIAVHEFAPRRAEFFLLDVREEDEFAEAAIPGARLVPLNSLADRLGELPLERPIVCVCAVGGRSGRATTILREHGFDARNLRGGMRAWVAAGGDLA